MTPRARREAAAEAEQRRRIDRVCALYRIVQGREADQEGLLAYSGQLRDGVGLDKLVAEFFASDECRRRQLGSAFDSVDGLLELYAAAFGAPAAQAVEQAHRVRLEQAIDAPSRLAKLIELAAPSAGLPQPLRRTGDKARDAASYDLWRLRSEAPSPVDPFHSPANGPRLSWIMFIAGDAPERLDEAIASVRAQSYETVELVVVGRANRALARAIAQHVSEDHRIRWIRPAPWVSPVARLRRGIAEARGDYVGLFGAADHLAADAGLAFAAALNEAPSLSLVYADEDQINEDGRRVEPWFKTDWDPESFLAMDTVGRPALARKTLLLEAARRLQRLGPAWRHELLLQLSEGLEADHIRDVSRVLYHRRATPQTPSRRRDRLASRSAARLLAADHEATGDPLILARDRARAVGEHLTRLGLTDYRVAPAARGATRVIWPVRRPAPLVSIIIPTRDKSDLLATCMAGLLERTDYAPFEVLVVDNGSVEGATQALFARLKQDHRVRVLSYPLAFNWGAINNFAVESARGEVVVLLNNDTDVMDPEWLRELVAQAMRPQIGVVGATLFYRDLTVQHAGIVFGPGAESAHVGRYLAHDDPGYARRLSIVRSTTAVTGACMALRRSVYLSLGGVEAERLPVTWSDTDLCLKAWDQGLRVIMTPFARLYHLELATRGADETPEALERVRREREWMAQRWGCRLDHDPFHSDNLSIFGSYAE